MERDIERRTYPDALVEDEPVRIIFACEFIGKPVFQDPEKMTGRERKILIIGTLGTGKTTVALDLAKKTGYPYASIDKCRIQYSDRYC